MNKKEWKKGDEEELVEFFDWFKQHVKLFHILFVSNNLDEDEWRGEREEKRDFIPPLAKFEINRRLFFRENV